MRITLFRLHDDVTLSTNVLRRPSGYTQVATSSPAGVDLKLFVKAGASRPARWVTALATRTTDPTDLDSLRAASSSAILLAQADGPVFAVCFGGGFHGVDPSRYVRGFGIRVTANAIEGSGIKSADTRGLNRSGRSQKVILPVASALENLGIEPTEEWVRQLGGPARSTDFAATASGADSLKLSIKDFSLTALDPNSRPSRATTGPAATGSSSPSWTTSSSSMPPTPSCRAWRRGSLIWCSPGAPASPTPTPTPSTDHRLIGIRSATAEIPADGGRYLLTAGVWFRVADSYITEVTDALAGLRDLTDELNLPPWQHRSDGDAYIDEGTYNE